MTTLCPGAKERMQRLLRLVETSRIDLRPLITHTFPLDGIEEAYKLSAERKNERVEGYDSPERALAIVSMSKRRDVHGKDGRPNSFIPPTFDTAQDGPANAPLARTHSAASMQLRFTPAVARGNGA